MTSISVLICDRCKKEIRCEDPNPWRAWKRDTSIKTEGFGGAPDWIQTFEWTGTLCTDCASHVDNAIHVLMHPEASA